MFLQNWFSLGYVLLLVFEYSFTCILASGYPLGFQICPLCLLALLCFLHNFVNVISKKTGFFLEKCLDWILSTLRNFKRDFCFWNEGKCFELTRRWWMHVHGSTPFPVIKIRIERKGQIGRDRKFVDGVLWVQCLVHWLLLWESVSLAHSAR